MWPLQPFILLCLKLRLIPAEVEVPEDLEVDLKINATLPIYFKKTEVPYADNGSPPDMLHLVLSIIIALTALSSVFIICCYCMRRSDKKLQKYVLALAKRRGRRIDKQQLKCPPPSQEPIAESCPVLLADAGIIVP